MFGKNKPNGYQVKMDNKYTMEKSQFGIKWLKEQLKLINSTGYISEELGQELEKLYEDVGYIGNDTNFTHLGYEVGIHLTGYTPIIEDYINDVFEHGLINNGHSMNGGRENNTAPRLNLTITFIDSVPFAVRHLKLGRTYKGSQGAFILKFPKEAIKEFEKTEYFDGSCFRILPEYVYGFVPIMDREVVGDMTRNPNFHLSDNRGRI